MSSEPTTPLPPMPSVPPKSRGSRKPFLTGLVTGFMAASLVAAGIFLVVGSQGDADSASAADSKPTAEATPASVPEPVEEPEEIYNEAPSKDEFTITLKTTQKQCFGSAGCHVTVEPELAYSGLVPANPDKTYSITYEVRGGEDGVIVQTLELTDQDQVSYQPINLTTTRSSAKLTAKVTDVDLY
ncbi:hypothetical protein OTC26_007060 [Streptomyces tirandamycinicus]|nr:hypothetical protein [Streptomyces tirandamycinicus]